MKKMTLHFCIILAVFCVGVYGAHVVLAEDLKFPSTEEEIIDILGVKPPDSLKFSLEQQDGANPRGLAGIKDDELAKAPKAGALILFDFNSATIKDESQSLLRLYGNALQGKLKDAVLLVAGHTDSKGSDIYNLGLARKRAESVKNFLVSEFKIADTQLIVKPYGERKPIASNANSEGRAMNRRVEFIRVQ